MVLESVDIKDPFTYFLTFTVAIAVAPDELAFLSPSFQLLSFIVTDEDALIHFEVFPLYVNVPITDASHKTLPELLLYTQVFFPVFFDVVEKGVIIGSSSIVD